MLIALDKFVQYFKMKVKSYKYIEVSSKFSE